MKTREYLPAICLKCFGYCLTNIISLYQTFFFHQTEHNFTGPNKYQAFPAVVAFNQDYQFSISRSSNAN